jgi:hypothetical protein
VGKITSCCLICGDRHNAFVPCPCPRCLVRHAGDDCPSVEEWRNVLSDGSFERFVGSHCVICGQVHMIQNDCSCPRCFCRHTGTSCSDFIAFTISHREEVYVGAIERRCVLCGEIHESTICPCPRCFYLHADADCPSVPSAAACGRCNIWHGADVCLPRVGAVNMYHQQKLPRAQMFNRAVMNISLDIMQEIAAPVHNDAASDRHDVGIFCSSCAHCGAQFWQGEKIVCCFDGSLSIPDPEIPESLNALIMSSAVQHHIRAYNMAMAMASVGHDKKGFPDGVFVMSGKSYHQVGTLIPNDGQPTCFAQIYTLDTESATDRRLQIFGDTLNREVLCALHNEMILHNRFVSEFVRAVADDVHELIWTTEDNIMNMQMGAMVSAVGKQRSIIIQRRGNIHNSFAHDLQFIDDGHSLYHTLAYPLLFPTGARGWFSGMTRYERNSSTPRSVSLHDYGRYMLMHRARYVDD